MYNSMRIAGNSAMKSPCKHRHGAVLLKGNKVFARGYNKDTRCHMGSLTDYCIHAEVDVMWNGIKMFKMKKIRKMTLLCVRISERAIQMGVMEFVNSKPCVHCYNRMKIMGIRKVAYSTNDGTVECVKMKNFETTHICTARKQNINNSTLNYITSIRGYRVF